MTFKFNPSIKTRSFIDNEGSKMHVPQSATFHQAGAVCGVYFRWVGKWAFSCRTGFYIWLSGEQEALEGMQDGGAAWLAEKARKAKKA
ncbi:hypothetical protein RCIP0073_00059 [Klebsiella phage RCIP0073]